MLAHDPSLCVIKDDELDRFIDPSITEPELNTLVSWRDLTMPQTTRELDWIRRFLSIKADDERRGMDGVDNVGVMGVRSEVLIVLKKTERELHGKLQDHPP